MGTRQWLCLLGAVIFALPMIASAEVYKWKDKDGVTRYTDTPPPSNIKQEKVVGKKKPQAATVAAPAAAEKAVVPPKAVEQWHAEEEAAAKLRQKNAEIEKKNKEEAERAAKLKEENCKAARANYQSYVQGGRVYMTNENGERNFLSDDELKAGAEQAQAQIDEYCN